MDSGEIEGPAEPTWLEEEVMRLLPDLFGSACHMADTRAEAEDLVAEAVARAWEHRGELRERDRLRGWLFRILRNCFLSQRRKRDVRPEEVPLPDEGDGEAAFSLFERLHQPFLLWWANPEKEFFDRLLREDLQRAVDDLPEAYRTVVVLADVQGFTYAEIADVLDVPLGTVRSRLARGRSRLQEALWSHAVDAGLRDPDGCDAGMNGRSRSAGERRAPSEAGSRGGAAKPSEGDESA